jgi:hypothetical protein
MKRLLKSRDRLLENMGCDEFFVVCTLSSALSLAGVTSRRMGRMKVGPTGAHDGVYHVIFR